MTPHPQKGSTMLRNFWQSLTCLSSPRTQRSQRGNFRRVHSQPSLEVLEDRQLLAAGALDPSFGTNGIVIRDHGTVADGAQAVAIQADGKFVIAGNGSGASGEDRVTILTRYNANGSLDDGGPNDSSPGDAFGVSGNGRVN